MTSMILWSPAGVRVLQSRPIIMRKTDRIEPVRSIGGDYGLVNPGVDHLDVLVCDVSGHSISSALVANRIYSETMTEIERGAELGPMLRHLNHFVVRNLASSASYLTMAAARFNRDCRSREMKQQVLDRVANWRSSPAADDVSLVLVEIPCWPQHCARPS